MSTQNGLLKVHNTTDVQITSLFMSQIRHKHAFVLQLYAPITFKIRCCSSFAPNFVKNTPKLPRRSPVNDVRSRASAQTSRLFYVAMCHKTPYTCFTDSKIRGLRRSMSPTTERKTEQTTERPNERLTIC